MSSSEEVPAAQSRNEDYISVGELSDAAEFFDCEDATDQHHSDQTDTKQTNTDSVRDAEPVESAATCPSKDPKAATATDNPPPAALASTTQDDHDMDDEADEEEDEAERCAEHPREGDRSESRRESEPAREEFSRRHNIARVVHGATCQQFLAIPLQSARDKESFAAQRASAEEARSQFRNHFAARFAAIGQESDARCAANRRHYSARCAAINGELDVRLAAIEVERDAMRDRRIDEARKLFREELDRRMKRRWWDCPEDICE